MGVVMDLKGQRFGRWLVEEHVGKVGARHCWRCTCDCGRTGIVAANNLRTGKSQGCGRKTCKYVHLKHGLQRDRKQTPEYRIWAAIKGRCLNPADAEYHNYGGRGIKMCQRWQDDAGAFVADMGPRPSPKHSVDRQDNDGHYEPGNCRWATIEEQANNRRNNVRLTFNGKTQTMAQWCRELGLNDSLVESRISRGWNPTDALTVPRMKPGQRYRSIAPAFKREGKTRGRAA